MSYSHILGLFFIVFIAHICVMTLGADHSSSAGSQKCAALLQVQSTPIQKKSAPHAVDNSSVSLVHTKKSTPSMKSRQSSGALAALSEKGYRRVVDLKSTAEMSEFVRRVVADLGFCVTEEGGLTGLSSYYSGERDTQSFSRLRAEIVDVAKHHADWILPKPCDGKRDDTSVSVALVGNVGRKMHSEAASDEDTSQEDKMESVAKSGKSKKQHVEEDEKQSSATEDEQASAEHDTQEPAAENSEESVAKQKKRQSVEHKKQEADQES